MTARISACSCSVSGRRERIAHWPGRTCPRHQPKSSRIPPGGPNDPFPPPTSLFGSETENFMGIRYSTLRASPPFDLHGIPEAAFRASSPSALIAPIVRRSTGPRPRQLATRTRAGTLPRRASPRVRVDVERHPWSARRALRQLGEAGREHLPDVVGRKRPEDDLLVHAVQELRTEPRRTSASAAPFRRGRLVRAEPISLRTRMFPVMMKIGAGRPPCGLARR